MADAELTEHNRRVYRWAKAFDRKYYRAAATLGWATDRDTHATLNISWPALVKLSREHAGEGRMDGPVPNSTLRRHAGEMKSAGVVKWEPSKQGFADKRRGMQAANVYHADFTKVISEGRTVVHDFWAPLEDDYSPPNEQQETVTEQQGKQQGEHVSSSSSGSSDSRKDLSQARARESEPEEDSGPEQKPAPGRGRVPFSYPAFKPSAATEKNPSVDARLTGSPAHDLIHAQFPDSVEQEMASEFVKLFRDFDYRQVVRAAGFFFGENSWAFGRVRNPRAYARKCQEPIRETLDGWKQQEESYRRCRESKAAEARREAERARRAAQEEAGHAARGEVRIDLFSLDDPAGVPEWLPRGQAVQITDAAGRIVWIPKAETDTDSGPGTMEPDPGISIDELLGDGRHESEPGTGRR